MSARCCLVLVQSVQEATMPVASAVAGVHRDILSLASNAQWPEIQPLVSRGQIVSTDLPLLTDTHTQL